MEASPPLFSLKTLGRGVTLGELYDFKSSQFLGVQICPVTDIKDITHTSDTPFLDSHIKSSDSLKSKTDVLDISAELSVEILSGLISVSGAATYLNDTKSNSKEHAWGLSLYARTKHESFDVNHSKVKANIYKTDVIKHYGCRATHVVTEILYGGTIIVNFFAKEESKIENTHIARKLEAKLKMLNGAFDVSGQVKLDVKEGCSTINKDVDLTIHADVALDRIPVDVLTLLDMIPHACENINNNPVPISVVLKRIPFEAFKESGFIRNLENFVVDSVIKKFGELMDIQNRFFALQGSTAKHKDLIPNLASAINEATLSFRELTIPLLDRLAAYVAAYKSDKPKEKIFNLLAAVQIEIEKQKSSSQNFLGYPTHLAGLEDAFKSFALLNYKIANRTKNSKFCLTPLPDLRKDLVFTPIVALLIVPPLPAKPHQIKHLAIRALLDDAVAHYASIKPPVKLHIVYAEDLSKIDTALRGNGMFIKLKRASVFLAQKKMGTLSWTPVPEKDIVDAAVQLCDLRLHLSWFEGSLATLSLHGYIPYIDSDKTTPRSQTLILRAQYYVNIFLQGYFAKLEGGPSTSYTFCVRRDQSTTGNIDYLDVKADVPDRPSFFLFDGEASLTKLNPMQNFHCAFVQDCEKSPATWTLYFNGALVGRMPGSINVMSRWRDVQSCDGINGKLYDVRVYDTALNPIQIAADSLNQYTV